uniref:TACC_C domain-containing protein n=1 Tax=Parastrongyloides trichosuri TaxID=131310 RepID=A0A0N4ZA12_PARTI
MAISTTIISETYTETTETREKEVPYVDSKKLNNRLESLRQRLKEYKNDKQCIAQEMYDISLNIEIYQESVKNKQKMIDDLNSGMNMILKETQKWIDVWKKEEGRVRLEKNAKNINENYIQVDQLSTYIMHLREAILNKRILIEQREIDLENRKELNKMSIEEIKDEIKVLKDGISNLKSKLNEKDN